MPESTATRSAPPDPPRVFFQSTLPPRSQARSAFPPSDADQPRKTLSPSAGAGGRLTVVAAPIRSLVGVPRRVAAIASPADQSQADALVPEGVPGIVARRHGLARRAPVHRGEPVPGHVMSALRVEGGVQELPDGLSAPVLDVERDIPVLRHGERDRLEAFEGFGLDESGPIHDGAALFEFHRKLSRVGQSHGRRLDLAAAFQRGVAPALAARERRTRDRARPRV